LSFRHYAKWFVDNSSFDEAIPNIYKHLKSHYFQPLQ